MNKIEYERMAEMERTYWWHVGRLRIIEAYLKKINKSKISILNVGCGTGGTIDLLAKYGTVDNIDVSDDAIKFMRQNGYDRIKKVAGTKLATKSRSYDLVVAFDVLEHIENDSEALAEWIRVLKDDGNIIVTVPAYDWLWSGHDVSLHHFRRYSRKALKAVAEKSGLRVAQISFAIVFSLPLVVVFRALNSLSGEKTDSETSYVKLPSIINSLFTNLLFVEAKFHRVISFPLGTSLIAIFEKKHD